MTEPLPKRMRLDGNKPGAATSEPAASTAPPRRGKSHVRQLGDWAAAPVCTLSPAWLVKSATQLPAGHPSPAAVQSSRLVLRSGDAADGRLCAFVASGARVYEHSVRLASSRSPPALTSLQLPWPAAAPPQQGKEGILVPGATQARKEQPLRSRVHPVVSGRRHARSEPPALPRRGAEPSLLSR